MNSSDVPSGNRIVARSKFLFDGNQKFYLQGVTYGPFRPETPGGPCLPGPEKAERDFRMIRDAGLNVLRLYHSPPRWLLDMAWKYGLRVLTTIPWPLRGLFLDDPKVLRQIRENAREAARANSGHPAVLGFYVDNEMQPDLVRWYGPRKIENFFNSLIQIVKDEDPGALASYANFPPTEYVTPRLVDFYSYNVYLHNRNEFSGYLARLQNIAGDKPLVIGEFGMDTIRHSQEEQAQLIAGHYEEVFRGGAAGTILFSFTDEWFTGGQDITDWAFGLVDRKRKPKLSYHTVAEKTIRTGESVSEKYPIADAPKVSVVVCTYNGGKTLRGCLETLGNLKYPDYEVVVVDDGSRDDTQEILADFPWVSNIRQGNLGLSVARNNGMKSGTGSVIAYTDSDCMPDEDWLYHLVQTLIRSQFAAVGGPNISPPAVNWIQAAVAAAPGAPSHVLLSDTEAEHVPGCNMAYHRWALEMIDGFDPVYRKAGDDVDLCWRLMARGHKVAFSPAAVVWHHRRFTVNAYFGQQKGYGEAEALLRYKHLNFFDDSGSARWKGTIYGAPMVDDFFGQPIIYHGEFAMGFFQSIYRRPEAFWKAIVGSLQWNIATLFILVLSMQFEVLRVVPLLMFGATLLSALSYMGRAHIEPKFDTIPSRLLLLYLALTQPWSRAWARYFTWLEHKRTPKTVLNSKEEELVEPIGLLNCGQQAYWGEKGLGREILLGKIVERLNKEGWRYVLDNGWGDWDIEILTSRWWHVRLRTLSEHYPEEKRLTRVANTLVMNTFSILTLLIIAGLALTFGYMFAPYWWAVLGAALAAPAYGFWRGLVVRHRIGELVQVAAGESGLISIANDADRK
ncbi:MAG: glycosyltransferase [Methylacidiphilales bacterium]|nr:glycosyltransferase [Candidatus Methylacidiphilales bacterium]